MTKQYIRLKNFSPNLDELHSPAEKYISHTDGTLDIDQYRLRTDECGFIKTGNSLNGTGDFIYFLGDSLVESIYCHEDQRFCSIFERKLNFSGFSARALNAGYSGATLLHIYNTLINKVYPHSGEGHVYVFFPMSDVDYMDVNGGYWNITERGTPVLPVGNLKEPGTKVLTLRDSIARLTCLIADFCSLFNMQLTLVIAPFRKTGYAGIRSGFESRLQKRLIYNQILREWVHGRAINVLDLEMNSQILCGHFHDELHLNSEGQALVANILLDEWMRNDNLKFS